MRTRGCRGVDGKTQYPPALLALDRSADRQSIIDGLKPFVEAWNRGHPIPVGVFDRGLSGHQALNPIHRQYTRLDGWPQSIDFPRADRFSLPYSPHPFITLRLAGTFTPRPGVVWPIEPWKQEGALTFVRVSLRRVDGWWRVGKWRITALETPWWSDFRVSH